MKHYLKKALIIFALCLPNLVGMIGQQETQEIIELGDSTHFNKLLNRPFKCKIPKNEKIEKASTFFKGFAKNEGNFSLKEFEAARHQVNGLLFNPTSFQDATPEQLSKLLDVYGSYGALFQRKKLREDDDRQSGRLSGANFAVNIVEDSQSYFAGIQKLPESLHYGLLNLLDSAKNFHQFNTHGHELYGSSFLSFMSVMDMEHNHDEAYASS